MATLHKGILYVSENELAAIYRVDKVCAEALERQRVSIEKMRPIYRAALIAIIGERLVAEIAGGSVEMICADLGPQHCGVVEVH